MRYFIGLFLALVLVSTNLESANRWMKEFSIGSALQSVSNIFEVNSTTKASRPYPVMTTSERDAIASPDTGSMIFNSDTNLVEYYNGTEWQDSKKASVVQEYGPIVVLDELESDITTTASDTEIEVLSAIVPAGQGIIQAQSFVFMDNLTSSDNGMNCLTYLKVGGIIQENTIDAFGAVVPNGDSHGKTLKAAMFYDFTEATEVKFVFKGNGVASSRSFRLIAEDRNGTLSNPDTKAVLQITPLISNSISANSEEVSLSNGIFANDSVGSYPNDSSASSGTVIIFNQTIGNDNTRGQYDTSTGIYTADSSHKLETSVSLTLNTIAYSAVGRAIELRAYVKRDGSGSWVLDEMFGRNVIQSTTSQAAPLSGDTSIELNEGDQYQVRLWHNNAASLGLLGSTAYCRIKFTEKPNFKSFVSKVDVEGEVTKLAPIELQVSRPSSVNITNTNYNILGLNNLIKDTEGAFNTTTYKYTVPEDMLAVGTMEVYYNSIVDQGTAAVGIYSDQRGYLKNVFQRISATDGFYVVPYFIPLIKGEVIEWRFQSSDNNYNIASSRIDMVGIPTLTVIKEELGYSYQTQESDEEIVPSTGVWMAMSNNSITLSAGTHRLYGMISYSASGGSGGYGRTQNTFALADGDDTSTRPTRIDSILTSGIDDVVFAQINANLGSAIMNTVVVTVTEDTEIFLVPRSDEGTAANQRVVATIWSEKI